MSKTKKKKIGKLDKLIAKIHKRRRMLEESVEEEHYEEAAILRDEIQLLRVRLRRGFMGK